MYKIFLIPVLLAILLITSGCSSTKNDNTPQNNDTSQEEPSTSPLSSSNEENNIKPKTENNSSNKTLLRQDLGFSLEYPTEFNLEETQTCLSSCPPKRQIPTFTLTNNTIGALSIFAFESQSEALENKTTSAQTILDFLSDANVVSSNSSQINLGTRYDLVLKDPSGLAPNTFHVFMVRDSGAVIEINGVNTYQQQILEIADSFNFI